MNYLIAVLPDRIQAEAAYSALEEEGLPMGKVSILGRGYKSADEFGLIDPKQDAKKRSLLMSFWLVPFGFVAGYAFNFITKLETFPWAGHIGNHIIGGLLGAGGGAMGSLFAGRGFGFLTNSSDDLPYRKRLEAGKYLVVVKGTDSLTKQATPILRQFNPENIQGYVEQTDF